MWLCVTIIGNAYFWGAAAATLRNVVRKRQTENRQRALDPF
jgi:hypothetical protein